MKIDFEGRREISFKDVYPELLWLYVYDNSYFLDIRYMVFGQTIIIQYLFLKLKISYILIKGGIGVSNGDYVYDNIELCVLPYMLIIFIMGVTRIN